MVNCPVFGIIFFHCHAFLLAIVPLPSASLQNYLTVSYGPKGSGGNSCIVPVNEYCRKYYSEYSYVIYKNRAVKVTL
jgi:hypothetical protein